MSAPDGSMYKTNMRISSAKLMIEHHQGVLSRTEARQICELLEDLRVMILQEKIF